MLNNNYFSKIVAVLMVSLPLISVSSIVMAGKSLDDCINLAMDNGYGDEHCASLFIEVCTTTSSKAALEKQFWFDSSQGTVGLKMCGPVGNPNGKKYSEAWRKIYKARDQM